MTDWKLLLRLNVTNIVGQIVIFNCWKKMHFDGTKFNIGQFLKY